MYRAYKQLTVLSQRFLAIEELRYSQAYADKAGQPPNRSSFVESHAGMGRKGPFQLIFNSCFRSCSHGYFFRSIRSRPR